MKNVSGVTLTTDNVRGTWTHCPLCGVELGDGSITMHLYFQHLSHDFLFPTSVLSDKTVMICTCGERFPMGSIDRSRQPGWDLLDDTLYDTLYQLADHASCQAPLHKILHEMGVKVDIQGMGAVE